MDGAGRGETVNLLNEWMDPRHILTQAFGEMSDEGYAVGASSVKTQDDVWQAIRLFFHGEAEAA